MIDLRSDTVTLPTDEMRRAMAAAIVGDDVYGEDQTINHLQQISAELLGMEAGLFVPSGTMGNLISILTHCQRGDEVIMGDQAHTFIYEVGGVSALGGIMVHTIPNMPNGTLALYDIKNAIRSENVHFPTTRLICLENTHNRCGGVAITPEYTQEVVALANKNQLSTHMDGARIFNAAAKLNIPAKELIEGIDSVTFCLSKGLGAPVGSIICGSNEFIQRARKIRKQLGGGMRQAGILAAAGLVALETMLTRLSEDHVRAQNLAYNLKKIPGLILKENSPQTNMVFINLDENVAKTSAQIITELSEFGVLVGPSGQNGFRLVTHYGIRDEDLLLVQSAFESVLGRAF